MNETSSMIRRALIHFKQGRECVEAHVGTHHPFVNEFYAALGELYLSNDLFEKGNLNVVDYPFISWIELNVRSIFSTTQISTHTASEMLQIACDKSIIVLGKVYTVLRVATVQVA